MEAKGQRIVNDVNMSQITGNVYTVMTTPKHMINKVLTKIRAWREVSRQRRELRELSDNQLKDIGISRADAIREAHRAFWDNKTSFDVSLRERTKLSRGLITQEANSHAAFNPELFKWFCDEQNYTGC